MSEYTELQNDLLTVMDSLNDYGRSVNSYADVVNEQVAKLWQDNAELRDELHAVANRVESLTRAVMADPAEVAQAIVNDANRSTLSAVQPSPLCECGHRYDHHRHHGLTRCYEQGCPCNGYVVLA